MEWCALFPLYPITQTKGWQTSKHAYIFITTPTIHISCLIAFVFDTKQLNNSIHTCTKGICLHNWRSSELYGGFHSIPWKEQRYFMCKTSIGNNQNGFRSGQHNSSTSAHIHELYFEIDFKSSKLWLISANILLEMIVPAAKTVNKQNVTQ